jgi:hypothetical protein
MDITVHTHTHTHAHAHTHTHIYIYIYIYMEKLYLSGIIQYTERYLYLTGITQ